MMSVRRFVLLTDLVGVCAVAGVFLLVPRLPVPADIPATPQPGVLAAVMVIILVGQAAYVRVRHGETTEELNFLEAAMTIGLLTVPARGALLAGLLGILLAELLLRRAPIKLAYNLGSWATSASLMVVVFYAVTQGDQRFSVRAVIAMVLGALVFATWNIGSLSQLIHVRGGPPLAVTLREEWPLSGFIAVAGAGIGMMAVALFVNAPALVVFAFLPAAALWFTYGSVARHAEARERNRWLVRLGGMLAQQRGTDALIGEAAMAVAQVVGAPDLLVVQPGSPLASEPVTTRAMMTALAAEPGPVELGVGELPTGWRTGWATRLDAGTASPGAIVLGSTVMYTRNPVTGRERGWTLREADAPVLGALVGALGSSLSAGAAYEKVSQETAKLTAVVDNTSDGIAVVDESGQVLLWSRTMARMTGVAAGELLDLPPGTPLLPIVDTLLGSVLPEAIASPTASASAAVELVRPDGEQLDVAVTCVRVMSDSPDGTPGTWVSILTVHDETRERRVERMKTDFVATISHELRTPITPIKGYAHLLAKRGDRLSPDKRQAALQTISDRADHLTRLVDDLLLASRVSDGARLAVDMGLEDLSAIMASAVGMFPAMASRVAVTYPPEPVSVQCDRVRAVQCLSNLIGNAEKYTPPGTPIEVWVEEAGLQVRIHVRDHGPGIPPQEQSRVFERFYRIEDPFTRKTGGAGLGLHIARELAIAMGGGLTLENPAGGGAEFVLHLATSEAPAVGSAVSGQHDANDPQAAPRPDTVRLAGLADRAGATIGTVGSRRESDRREPLTTKEPDGPDPRR